MKISPNRISNKMVCEILNSIQCYIATHSDIIVIFQGQWTVPTDQGLRIRGIQFGSEAALQTVLWGGLFHRVGIGVLQLPLTLERNPPLPLNETFLC